MNNFHKKKFIVIKPNINNDVIKKSFNFIPLDPYFDGGYRYRTKSRIQVLEDGSLKLLEKKDLYQPSHINSYVNYGGISRSYQDIPEWLVTNENFVKLIKYWLDTIPKKIDIISVHQIRTATNFGKTVPEGRHRDGYDYIAVYVVARHNIVDNCALTKVWCNETNNIIFENYLDEGNLISFDDNLVTHYTSDIISENENNECYRDVLILTCPDEGIY